MELLCVYWTWKRSLSRSIEKPSKASTIYFFASISLDFYQLDTIWWAEIPRAPLRNCWFEILISRAKIMRSKRIKWHVTITR